MKAGSPCFVEFQVKNDQNQHNSNRMFESGSDRVTSINMASGRGGTQRVLGKLEASIKAGQYYEAHQMYRTLYFRYNAQKKYAEAIDLLYNGATKLLECNQHGSGSDLALLLVEVLQGSDVELSSETLDKLSKLHGMLEADSPDRPSFVANALRWSTKASPSHRTGHPDLHQKFALTFWQEKNYVQARYHFLHSADGEGCATMLVEYHVTTGFSSEADLFIAQAVFQYLCLSNKSTAETAFHSYTQKHPQVEKGPPFVRPLLNFLWFLLLAIEGGKVAVFTILCEQYQTALRRDPCYNEYLDRIGQLFFGLPPPKSANQGLFGNLIQSLFNMDDDSDEEEGTALGQGASSRLLAQEELD